MSNKSTKQEQRSEAFKNEATRLRWDYFHRAIARAKESNTSELEKASGTDDERPRPLPSGS